MHIDLPLIDLGYADLSVVVAGKQDCPPSHSHGPAVRDYYLIHYSNFAHIKHAQTLDKSTFFSI